MIAGFPYALTKSPPIVSQCRGICKFSEHVRSPCFEKFDKGSDNLSNILIRNVPAKTIAALDELANKNIQSREEYIRRLLEHHVMYSEVEGLNKKYETLVQEISQNMILALNENSKALNEFIDLKKEEI